MKTITHNGTLYEIEPNCYDGDMLLLSPSQDVNIQDGYAQLRMMAEEKVGHDRQQVDYWMEEHLEEFIVKNFKNGTHATTEREALGAAYVEEVGYNPFEDEPTITVDEVRQMLDEVRAKRQLLSRFWERQIGELLKEYQLTMTTIDQHLLMCKINLLKEDIRYHRSIVDVKEKELEILDHDFNGTEPTEEEKEERFQNALNELGADKLWCLHWCHSLMMETIDEPNKDTENLTWWKEKIKTALNQK